MAAYLDVPEALRDAVDDAASALRACSVSVSRPWATPEGLAALRGRLAVAESATRRASALLGGLLGAPE